MKKFLEEFKAFALKGNVLDMAVGVIIGAAFQNIVKALTDNFISPLLGILFRANLDNLKLSLFDGALVFGYGAFLTAVINFILMALVLFCIVKFMNRLMTLGKKEEAAVPAAPKAPTTDELLAAILTELKAQNRSDAK